MDGIIHIQSNLIHETLDCTICLCIFKEPIITVCGHSFCKNCIEECINRTHNCPLCKSHLEKNQLWRNYKIDQFILMIEKAKSLSQQMINEKLEANDPSYQGNPEMLGSPFIDVARKYIRNSLYQYEKYFESLKKDVEDFKSKIKLKYALSIANEINEQNFGKSEEQKRVELDNVDKKFQNSLACLLDSYESFLNKALVLPEQLPMKITTYIESKGIRIDTIFLNFFETGFDARKKIEDFFNKKNDPLVKFNEDSHLYLINNYVDNSKNVPKLEDIMQEGLEAKLINDESKPLKLYGVNPGSLILLVGNLKLQSDTPKPCFSILFKKDSNQLVDYFSCGNCNLTWICENCIKFCHRGHNIKEQLSKHNPTWACCYCSKNKLCKLPNKNNSSSIIIK